jgi:hypothetical protein
MRKVAGGTPEKVDAYNEKGRAEYASVREAEHQAAANELNKRLREQVRRNRERGRAAATPDEGGLDTVFGLY